MVDTGVASNFGEAVTVTILGPFGLDFSSSAAFRAPSTPPMAPPILAATAMTATTRTSVHTGNPQQAFFLPFLFSFSSNAITPVTGAVSDSSSWFPRASLAAVCCPGAVAPEAAAAVAAAASAEDTLDAW